MSSPRIVFFGTPEFAIPTLERLHRDWNVCAVVTTPDAPAGRGRRLQSPPIKHAAEKLGISPILQPPLLRDDVFINELSRLEADIFCVLAFRILPHAVITLPKLAFNVHPSLLPRYRGAAPIAHTIIAGDQETGVTTFILSDRVDAGLILLQERVTIPDGLTAGELAQLLAPLCAKAATRTIAAWCDGTLHPTPQDEENATTAPKLYSDRAWIDWQKDARSVRNWIHGHSPEPGAWTLLDGTRLKIYRAHIVEENLTYSIAGSWQMTDSEWLVRCGKGMLALIELQLPGKRRMTAHEFLRGWRGQRCSVFQAPLVTSTDEATG